MSDAAGLPVIDTRRLSQLDSLGGEGVLGELVGLFRRELPGRLSGLRRGLSTGDRLAVERSAHTLRGSGGQLGLPRVQATAARLEESAATEPFAGLGAQAAVLEAEVQEALLALERRIAAVAEAAPVEAPSPAVEARPSAHVLVVEDEPHIGRFVEYVLGRAGFLVSRAATAAEALASVEQALPDAIVLDLALPDRSGNDVLREVRGARGLSVPVVVLTARASSPAAAEAVAAGANALCAKPIAPTTLLATLSRLGVVPGASGPSGAPSATRRAGSGEPADDALLREVAAGWEALEALQAVLTPDGEPAGWESTRRKVAEKLRRIRPGLEAAVWVASVDPAAATERAELPGVLGLALRQGRPILVEGEQKLAGIPRLEGELAGARSVFAVPFSTPSGLHGAVVAWRRDDARIDAGLSRLAASLAGQAAVLLENAHLVEAQRERERLEQEIAIGAGIQRALLVSEPPAGLRGLECATLWMPCREVGGDFLDFVSINGGRLDVALGDVMGKGVPAALLGAATKSHLLRSFAECGEYASPEALVQAAHDRLFAELVALERFVTLCFARFDPAAQQLRLVDAGHTRTLQLRQGRCTALAGENVPFGFREHEKYVARRLSTLPGDVYLFYSDGVTDCRDAAGVALGEDGLARWFEERAGLDPARLMADLENMLHERRPGCLEDDATAVCVRVGDPQ